MTVTYKDDVFIFKNMHDLYMIFAKQLKSCRINFSQSAAMTAHGKAD